MTPTAIKAQELVWSDTSDKKDKSKLLASLQIMTSNFHVEAFEVHEIDVSDPDIGGEQACVNEELEEHYSDWGNACGQEGAFETVKIDGKTYAIFMSPFCI